MYKLSSTSVGMSKLSMLQTISAYLINNRTVPIIITLNGHLVSDFITHQPKQAIIEITLYTTPFQNNDSKLSEWHQLRIIYKAN